MPVELRPYQTDAVHSFFEGVDGGEFRRGLCVAATGTGKTVTMAKAIHTQRRRQKAIGDTRPIVFLAHRTELNTQARDTFKSLMPYLDVQIEQGGEKATPSADVVVASVQTVGSVRKGEEGYKRMPWLEDRGGPSMLLVDECHRSAAAGYMKFAERIGCFDGSCLVWGTTATPQRMDKRHICKPDGTALLEKEFFNYGLIPAISDGWLCPIRGYLVVTETDLSTVKLKGGDYDPQALSDAVDKDERTEIAYRHWKEKCGDRLTLGFCASVAHAKHSAEFWVRQGIVSEYVSGDMPLDERRRILGDFRTGRIRVLFGCEVLTEGYDCPPVSCVLCLRPTKSGTLHAQCIGRGTRLFDGDQHHPRKHDCIILDVTDNSLVHRLDERGGSDNNQTLSSIIGLPDGVDLEGQDIVEAKAAWDAAEEGGKDTTGVCSISGLRTAAKAIDLVGEAKLAPEVQKHSSLAWAKVGTGYIITAPPTFSGQGQRVARLTGDTLGNWKLIVGDRSAVTVAEGVKGVPEFRVADTLLLSAWPDAKHLLSRRSAWRQKAPSEAQAKLLMKLGVKESDVAQMTMGDAGMLISKMKQGGVKAMWGAKGRMKS